MRNEHMKSEPGVVLTDTQTTTKNMLPPEIAAQLQQFECWQREKKFTEEIMHGLAASGGAERSRLYFEQVMYTVRNEVPAQLVQFMNTYVRGLKDGVQVQDSLEYAVLFQQVDLLKEILDRYEGNPFWQEWTKVYRFLFRIIQGELTYDEILHQANNLTHHLNDITLQLRIVLVKATAYEKLGLFNNVTELMDHFPKRLSRLEVSFMKSALISRAALTTANFLLLAECDVSKAERQFFNVAANNATPGAMLAAARHGLGLSTLCKEKSLCLEHFKKAISHARKVGLVNYHDQLKNAHYPFARNIHGEQFDVSNVVPVEKIHQYIVRNEKEQALRLAQELEDTGKGSVFLTFYKAKATKDKDLLFQVKDQFKVENFSYMLPIVDREIDSQNN